MSLKVKAPTIAIDAVFFGPVAEIVGKRSERLRVRLGTSAHQLLSEFVSSQPRLAGHKLLFSVNQEYVSGDAALKDGDEIAIFTAVSGG